MWSLSCIGRIFLSGITVLLSAFLIAQAPCDYEHLLSRHSSGETILCDFSLATETNCCRDIDLALLYRVGLDNPNGKTVKVNIERSFFFDWSMRIPSDPDSCFNLYDAFITTSDSLDVSIGFTPGEGWFKIISTLVDTTESCDDAILLNCGDNYLDINFDEITRADHQACEYYSRERIGSWFKIKGDGNLGRIYIDRNHTSHFDFSLNIYSGDCYDLQCLISGGTYLEYYFEQDSIYYLWAGSEYDIDGRDVNIEFNCSPVAANSYCESPANLLCGDTTNVFLGGLLGEFENHNHGSKDAYFKIIGKGDYIVLSPLNSVRQSFIIYPDSCASVPLTYFYPNTFFLEDGREYFIKLTSDASNGVADTAIFLTSCFPPTPLTSCFQATKLLVDSSHIGTLRYSESTFIPNQCSYADSLRSKWFTIVGANKLVDVTTNQEFLVYRGSCDSLQCVSSYIDQFNQFIPLGEQYHLLLYEKHNAPANYQVDNKITEVTPNAFDTLPQQLTCGDSIAFNWNQSFNQTPWCSFDEFKTFYYTFHGNDQFVRFESNYMTFVRENLYPERCLELTNSGYYFLQQGHMYHIAIYYNNPYHQSGLKIQCKEPNESLTLEDPGILSCSDSIFNTTNFKVLNTVASNCLQRSQNRGDWYSFIGNDHILDLSIIGNVEKSLFELNCDTLLCLDYSLLSSVTNSLSRTEKVKVMTKASSIYYLYIHSTNDPYADQIGYDYTLITNCEIPVSNYICDNPKPILCDGPPIPLNAEGTLSQFDVCNWNNERETELFFTFLGEGQYVSFNRDVGVFSGSCEEPQCIESVNFPDGDLYFLEEDVSYTIVARAYEYYSMDLEMSCIPSMPPNLMSQAQLLSCDTTIVSDHLYFQSTNSPNLECISAANIIGTWYRIQNSGNPVKVYSENVHLAVFSNVSDSLQCVYPGRYYHEASALLPFDTIDEYFLLLYHPAQYRILPNYSFSIDCSAYITDDINADAEGAFDVNCGTMIQDSFTNVERSFPACSDEGHLSKYYTYTPESSQFISFKAANTDRWPDITITSDSNSCISPFVDFEGDRAYYVYDERDYYYLPANQETSIIFSRNYGYQSTSFFDLSLHCEQPIYNSLQSATIVMPNDTAIISTTFYTTDPGLYNSQFGRWFKIQGNDKINTLTVKNLGNYNSGSLPNFVLFKGASLDFISASSKIEEWNEYIEGDEDYYLFVQSNNGKFENSIQMILNTTDLESTSFDTPDTVSCGDYLGFDFTQALEYRNCWFFSKNYSLFTTIIGMGQYISFLNKPAPLELFIIKDPNSSDTCGWNPGDTFFLEDSINYVIVARAYSNQLVVDSIEVTCIEPQLPINCNEPILISCGDTIRDDISLVFPDSIYNATTIRKKYYKITGQNNTLHTTIMHYSGELFISKDSCSNQSESLRRFPYYFLEQDVDYFITYSQYANIEVPFEFIVTCWDYEPYAQCSSPDILDCGDSLVLDFNNALDTSNLRVRRFDGQGKLYFSFTGTGEFGSFEAQGANISFVNGTCTDGRIQLNTFSDYFFHQDTNYVLEISAYNREIPVTLKFSCHDPIYDNSSQMPQPISCNDTWSFNGKYRAPDILHNSYQDYFPQTHYWMSFTGEGAYAYFSDNSNQGRYFDFLIFKGDAALGTNQFEYLHGNNPFFFENDTSYLIALSLYNNYSYPQINFDLKLNCFSIPEQNECQGALPINCGEHIPIDYAYTEESLPSCTYAYGPNVYYSIVGHNNFVRFNTYNVMVSLMTGTCDNETCVEPYFEDVYFLQEGVSYLLNATSRFTNLTNYPIPHSVIVECIEPVLPTLDSISIDTSGIKCLTEGLLCDDNNRATVNDKISIDCRCQGQLLSELLCEFDTIHVYEIDTSFAIFQARKFLSSDGFIIPTSHTLFKSGEQIEFQPGFETLNGAVLEAIIEACNE